MSYFETIIRAEIERLKEVIVVDIQKEIAVLEKLIEHIGRIEAVCKFPNAEILFGDESDEQATTV